MFQHRVSFSRYQCLFARRRTPVRRPRPAWHHHLSRYGRNITVTGSWRSFRRLARRRSSSYPYRKSRPRFNRNTLFYITTLTSIILCRTRFSPNGQCIGKSIRIGFRCAQFRAHYSIFSYAKRRSFRATRSRFCASLLTCGFAYKKQWGFGT